MDEESRNFCMSPDHKKREARRVRHFLIKVGLVYAVISVVLYFMFSTLMRDQAHEDMSEDEVHHISEMVFESMFTAMLSGQGMKSVAAAARRMEKTGPGMTISVVRGEVIEQKFGENKLDKMRRLNDLAIFEVFKSGQEHMSHTDDRIRFLYPAVFREECVQCHTNSRPGIVAGVIEIIYPIKNLKVSTDYVNKLMMAYFISSFILLIIFLSRSYRR